MADPIHQFQINKLFTIAKVGLVEIAFTNSALYMVLAVTVICAFLIVSTRARALVAVLQAYVFAILTCIYLNDALHPGH